jgi:hypothetical protein
MTCFGAYQRRLHASLRPKHGPRPSIASLRHCRLRHRGAEFQTSGGCFNRGNTCANPMLQSSNSGH